MHLPEVERGDGLFRRWLIAFISRASGMRLPDVVRVMWFKKAFFGHPLSAWTQAAMRGPSGWSVGERELMAALVAKWNACAFCAGAHRATASQALSPALADSVLADYSSADVSPQLKATLAFLEKLTKTPDALTAADARTVLAAGVDPAALRDAIAVAANFAIITRVADALDFAVPGPEEMSKAATRLLAKGYAV